MYGGVGDEALVDMAQSGDREAQDDVIRRFKPMVKVQAQWHFIMGGDREDIIQEGMIGLFKAMRDYDRAKSDSFSAFAHLCITRQIITAIKTATRQKHIPLNTYVSLNQPLHGDPGGQPYGEAISPRAGNSPEDLFISREEKLSMENQLGQVLSRLESQVLSLYLQGRSYGEIAGLVSRDEKSIDNALQRVRRKVSQFKQGPHHKGAGS